ncbi:hypothetical protein BCD49_09135 [Pseudofrankia sp. EUN1h]|nr:hypothetical protein BCD49_09135 [Pseudofrankia sp. EUN1h]
MFGNVSVPITLVDPVNLKGYLVVTDSQGQDLGPMAVQFGIRNDTSAAATYTFAAPPAGARVSVFADARPLFTDVVVTG